MRITNNHNISLPMQVWLLFDNYDYINEPNYISATSLLKPTKQIILAKRVPAEDKEMDISDNISRVTGHAFHDSIEKAWVEGGKSALKKLGYPEHICENIYVNPTPEYLANNPNCIPIWIERRSFREIDGFTIGGKFDMSIQGNLFDNKSTSVWTYMKSRKDSDYAMQGGIYKWLNEDIITEDTVYINFIFTDWQKFMTFTDPNYPKVKILEYPVQLPTMEEVEQFLHHKIDEIKRLWNKSEDELPACTDEELWRSEPKYKYYSDPSKTDGKSSKNFDDLASANSYLAEKGKGIVKTVLGEVKACGYCPAYPICKQREMYDV